MSDPVAALLARYDAPEAQRLYDEDVTERAHALQCGALALEAGAPDALVAAALLHDVGHLVLDDLVPTEVALTRDHRHERAGAALLARHFGPEVSRPVALHVAAKRYLCAVDPAYHGGLSPASVRSLVVQGGPMAPDEIAAFEADPHHDAAVRVRRWDDHGKVDGLTTPDPADFAPLLRRLLR